MLIQQTDLPVALILIVAAWFSFYTKKLTPSAAVTGFICAMIIYLGAGSTGLILMAVFFISGTVATGWGRKVKTKLERNSGDGRRKYGQVLANAGGATIMALLILSFPVYKSLFTIMLAATLASATADTLSSELGMLYGRKFYNCITFKKDTRGLDGVISLEGTLIGGAGAVLIAVIYVLGYLYRSDSFAALKSIFTWNSSVALKSAVTWNSSAGASFSTIYLHLLIIVFAGMIGNFSDSILGATLERRNLLNNDWVNFLSTMIAGTAACLFYVSFLLF